MLTLSINNTGSLSKTIKLLNLSYTDGPWVSGGAPLAIIEDREDSNQHDIDVFFHDEKQFHIFCEIADSDPIGLGVVMQTANGVHFRYNGSKINAISRRYYVSAEEVMNDIDITVCQVVADTNTFYMRDGTFADISNKVLRLSPAHLTKIFSRVAKYSRFGFTMDDKSHTMFFDEMRKNINDTKWFYDYDS